MEFTHQAGGGGPPVERMKHFSGNIQKLDYRREYVPPIGKHDQEYFKQSKHPAKVTFPKKGSKCE